MDKKKTFFEGEVTVSTLTNAIVSLIKIDPSIGSIHIKGKFSPMREEYISTVSYTHLTLPTTPYV